MKIIEPDYDIQEERLGQYYPVAYEDGRVTCSCGRELIQLDENNYKCSGGWPIYSFDQGDVMKDKFGNLLLRMKGH